MKRVLITVLLTLAVSVTLLAASAYLLGTSDELMLDLMMRYAPPEATGLPAAEYPAMVGMTTDYLAGRTETFQHTYTLNGTEVQAFNPKEQQHMADVQGLFTLAKTVMMAGLAIGGLMLAGLVLPDMIWKTGLTAAAIFAVTAEPPGKLRRSLRIGLLCMLGAVALIALWAAIDFDSLFILFHRLAFTNDLWWLDPRTDLLIRLMPTDFFVTYAALIGAAWATGMGLAILLTFLPAKENEK